MSIELRPVKRRLDFLGLPINIEIEAGDFKKGVDEQGQQWQKEYAIPYGEIDRTEGEDGDPVDVYLGPWQNPGCLVYVVHQLKRDRTPDEDKVMLGFQNAEIAEEAYRLHGPDWGFGSMDAMTLDEFKNGYLAANRLPPHQLHYSAADGERTGKTRYGS